MALFLSADSELSRDIKSVEKISLIPLSASPIYKHLLNHALGICYMQLEHVSPGLDVNAQGK